MKSPAAHLHSRTQKNPAKLACPMFVRHCKRPLNMHNVGYFCMKSPLALLWSCLLALVSLNSLAADIVPPAIQSASPVQGATIGTLTQITVTFSEPVTNVAPS